jgi:hypothetical protein
MKNGNLVTTIGATNDASVSAQVKFATVSKDGGLTWDEPRVVVDGGNMSMSFYGGELFLLPFHLRPRGDGIGAPYNMMYKDASLHYDKRGMTVTGLPRPVAHDRDSGTVGMFFNGQVTEVELGWLATMYGHFEGDKRYSLICVHSREARNWKFRSIISGHDCALDGTEGPCESAVCRLPDRRLMCVFRRQSGTKGELPYGQCFSSDEGKTWTTPRVMNGPGSVEPSLVVLPSGIVALSGGRPGVNVWLNADGTCLDWAKVDIAAHHSECHPADAIKRLSLTTDGWAKINMTGYTEIVRVDDNHLVMVYDRLSRGWNYIRDGFDESNSVWAMRIKVEKAKSK